MRKLIFYWPIEAKSKLACGRDGGKEKAGVVSKEKNPMPVPCTRIGEKIPRRLLVTEIPVRN